MQLLVGDYPIPGDCFLPTYITAVKRSDRGFAQRLTKTIGADVDLFATTSEEMTETIQEIFDNIGGDFRDVVILDDDGNPTAFKLINGDSIDGVKMIQPPTFPDLNTVYSLKVSFQVAWQADFSVEEVTNGSGDPNMLEFSESVQWQGNGGPRKIITLTPNGDPIISTVARKTAYFATQSGSMTTRGPISRIPKPIWPEAEIGEARSPAQGSPNIRNGVVESYSASWSYSFQSITPLNGQPTSIL